MKEEEKLNVYYAPDMYKIQNIQGKSKEEDFCIFKKYEEFKNWEWPKDIKDLEIEF